jgi:penicillin-binding protein 1A
MTPTDPISRLAEPPQTDHDLEPDESLAISEKLGPHLSPLRRATLLLTQRLSTARAFLAARSRIVLIAFHRRSGSLRKLLGFRLSIERSRVARRLSTVFSWGARRVRSACSRRWVRVASATALLLVLLPPTWAIYHVYFDRSQLPDLEPFLRFEPPGIGEVHDARGVVLIELAREYRRVVRYDEVPFVVREAVLAAEDKSFFSHSGVDYTALPRVIQKTAVRSIGAWWNGGGLRLRLPQGGSTLTQQLVRAYFLRERTSRQGDDTLFHEGVPQRLVALALGVPATNKLLRKLEEVRLSLWLEEEMVRRYGTKAQAKREIFARSASFHYVGNGRYGLAAGSEYYFGKVLSTFTLADAGDAAALAGIAKSPKDYAPASRSPRAVRRRNQILALMARNGSLPEAVARHCQAEPLLVKAPSPRKTSAPSAIGHVFQELTKRGGSRFGVEDLFQGRISVRSTVDERLQSITSGAMENGLASYEKRHPKAKGLIQGSVVVLRNQDAAVLAEVGGRQVYDAKGARYTDLNRVIGSLRQPGSAWKPIVYLAAFRHGLNLETTVPDEPISVPMGSGRDPKWIDNYDNTFKGPIPIRQALAESRNAVAVWITREIGLGEVIKTAKQLGIRSPVQPYVSTALGASEVTLLELADAYRAMASGTQANPHVIDRVVDSSDGGVLYEAVSPSTPLPTDGLSLIQEGLRGVVRMPDGTAHSLARSDFPVPVMGKTGTTSDFRDALFVGSTYGPKGITVAVRIGFDDNRALGAKETGGRAALPIFREIILRIYEDQLVGPAPKFPQEIERGIDNYLALQASAATVPAPVSVLPLPADAMALPSRGDDILHPSLTPAVTVSSALLLRHE